MILRFHNAKLPNEARDDRGSIIVATLLFFVIALLLVMGVSAASVAFVQQRNLASVCDSAAVAAATHVDLATIYEHGVAESGLSIDAAGARAEVATVLATAYPDAGGSASGLVSVVERGVRVECRTTAQIPFGAAFGYSGGLERVAVSTARMPTA